MRTCNKCSIGSDVIPFVPGRNECRLCYNERCATASRARYKRDHARIRAVKNAYKRRNREEINRKEREWYRKRNNISPLCYRDGTGGCKTAVGNLKNFDFNFKNYERNDEKT